MFTHRTVLGRMRVKLRGKLAIECIANSLHAVDVSKSSFERRPKRSDLNAHHHFSFRYIHDAPNQNANLSKEKLVDDYLVHLNKLDETIFCIREY